MVVQHNLRAMNANRMLNITTNAQAKSAEKLSSGYKINRAADDAAGLSISEKMRKQIRGLSQASNNAEDGISTVQTAEGALQEVQDMLQRMNELAVQSANGTNSSTDRASIQDEIDQLVTEIDRVAETTKFNETYLLKGDPDGSSKEYSYKTDAKVTSQDLFYVDDNGETQKIAKGTLASTVDANRAYFTSDATHKVGTTMDTTQSANYLETAVVVTKDGMYTKDDDDNYTAIKKGTVIDASTSLYSMNTTNDIHSAGWDSTASGNATVVRSGVTVYDSTGNQLQAGDSVSSTAADVAKLLTDITNEQLDIANSTTVTTETGTAAQLTDKDGNEIAANGLYKYFDENGTYSGGLYIGGKEATQEDVAGAVKSADTGTKALTMTFHVGADATTNNQITVDIQAMSAKGLGVGGLKVDGEDDTNALNAIETISAAIGKISEQRSALGAVQNRLEHTIKNLDNIVENTTSAESQIRDTDMATEMVAYSNNNILAQAGQSMLAQANQGNQGVLSLLG